LEPRSASLDEKFGDENHLSVQMTAGTAGWPNLDRFLRTDISDEGDRSAAASLFFASDQVRSIDSRLQKEFVQRCQQEGDVLDPCDAVEGSVDQALLIEARDALNDVVKGFNQASVRGSSTVRLEDGSSEILLDP
jgi:hypothetical protein